MVTVELIKELDENPDRVQRLRDIYEFMVEQTMHNHEVTYTEAVERVKFYLNQLEKENSDTD